MSSKRHKLLKRCRAQSVRAYNIGYKVNFAQYSLFSTLNAQVFFIIQKSCINSVFQYFKENSSGLNKR